MAGPLRAGAGSMRNRHGETIVSGAGPIQTAPRELAAAAIRARVVPASPSGVVARRSFGHPPEHISRTSQGIRAFNNNTGGARYHKEAAALAWRLITTGAACRAVPGSTSHRHRLCIEDTRRAPWLARPRREHAPSLPPDSDISRWIL